MTHNKYYDMAVLLTNAQFISTDFAHLFLQPVNCKQSLCLCGTKVQYDIEQTISIIEQNLTKKCFYTMLVESRSTFTQYITCAQRRRETLSTAQEKRYQQRICHNQNAKGYQRRLILSDTVTLLTVPKNSCP